MEQGDGIAAAAYRNAHAWGRFGNKRPEKTMTSSQISSGCIIIQIKTPGFTLNIDASFFAFILLIAR